MIPAHLWTYQARFDRAIDGDTVVLIVDYGFGIYKGIFGSDVDNHFRVKGVNCPEVRGPDKIAGLASKRFVEEWMSFGGYLYPWPFIIRTQRLRNREVRTFERWVAEVWRVVDGHSLAEDIIAAGHGTEAVE